MIRNLFNKLFGYRKRESRVRDHDWEKFQHVAKEQFVRLREKGLSIPVVTL